MKRREGLTQQRKTGNELRKGSALPEFFRPYIDDICQAIDGGESILIVGMPGVGKTRLQNAVKCELEKNSLRRTGKGLRILQCPFTGIHALSFDEKADPVRKQLYERIASCLGLPAQCENWIQTLEDRLRSDSDKNKIVVFIDDMSFPKDKGLARSRPGELFDFWGAARELQKDHGVVFVLFSRMTPIQEDPSSPDLTLQKIYLHPLTEEECGRYLKKELKCKISANVSKKTWESTGGILEIVECLKDTLHDTHNANGLLKVNEINTAAKRIFPKIQEYIESVLHPLLTRMSMSIDGKPTASDVLRKYISGDKASCDKILVNELRNLGIISDDDRVLDVLGKFLLPQRVIIDLRDEKIIVDADIIPIKNPKEFLALVSRVRKVDLFQLAQELKLTLERMKNNMIHWQNCPQWIKDLSRDEITKENKAKFSANLRKCKERLRDRLMKQGFSLEELVSVHKKNGYWQFGTSVPTSNFPPQEADMPNQVIDVFTRDDPE